MDVCFFFSILKLHFCTRFLFAAPKQIISALSIPFLHRHFLVPNDRQVRRFENHCMWCELCEMHVRNLSGVVEHIRNIDHNLRSMVNNGKKLKVFNTKKFVFFFLQRFAQQKRMYYEMQKSGGPRTAMRFKKYIEKVEDIINQHMQVIYNRNQTDGVPNILATLSHLNRDEKG